MATAKIVLGTLEGVDRPALAAVFPTAAGKAAVLLDVGANVDCKPHHLEQFAVMGEIYYRVIFGVDQPRVGLLSIGEEEHKGNDLTREAFLRLKELPVNFIGNVEGRDLYNARVEVVVCDGFIGNVALKISEGLIEAVSSLLKQALSSTLSSKVGYVLSRRAFETSKNAWTIRNTAARPCSECAASASSAMAVPTQMPSRTPSASQRNSPKDE
jgi:glycerol-3-phosphate acyltransferase PlsX